MKFIAARRAGTLVSWPAQCLFGMDLTASEIDRFYTYVRRGPYCWEWTGELNNQGYGRFAVYRHGKRVRFLAHRVGYFLFWGEDLGERVARHRCDNPLCIRGTHIDPGTQVENVRDAIERGRADFSGLLQWHRDRAARLRERIAAGVKVCWVCRCTKSFEDFHRNRTTSDGRQSICKSCRAKRQQKRTAA